MLKLTLFNYDSNYDLKRRITKYLNKNIQDIIEVQIDFIENDKYYTAEHFITNVNTRILNVNWTGLLYELRDIIKSDLIIDYVNPNYEFLLYEVLSTFEETENEISMINMLDENLEKEIKEKFNNGEEIVNAITKYDNYYDLLFWDFDFIPSNLEVNTKLFLESNEKFNLFLPDVNLDDYVDLMPKFLYDEYIEKKRILENKIERKKEENVTFFENLLSACISMQSRKIFSNVEEDVRNDEIRELLKSNHNISDQTRQGVSESGKKAGELDLKVIFSNIKFTILEGINLKGVHKSVITRHINKLLTKYDTLGNKENYILCYVNNKDFGSFWGEYRQFVSEFEYEGNIVKVGVDELKKYNHVKLRTIKIILENEGVKTNLTHIVVKMIDQIID